MLAVGQYVCHSTVRRVRARSRPRHPCFASGRPPASRTLVLPREVLYRFVMLRAAAAVSYNHREGSAPLNLSVMSRSASARPAGSDESRPERSILRCSSVSRSCIRCVAVSLVSVSLGSRRMREDQEIAMSDAGPARCLPWGQCKLTGRCGRSGAGSRTHLIPLMRALSPAFHSLNPLLIVAPAPHRKHGCAPHCDCL